MNKYKLLLAGLSVFLCTCSFSALVPALRNPDNDSENKDRLLLESALSQMLNGAEITIADDAFVSNSEIIIERSQQNRPGVQNRNSGRELELPKHFKLWMRGGNCLLEYVETGEMQIIEGLSCSAHGQA